MDILFILKKREQFDPAQDIYVGLSSGLHNSVSFVVGMLTAKGVKAHISVALDNNAIDRKVAKHKPKFVIIEALWVVPEKFEVLMKLHPHVKWMVRIHSELPFIAGEGMAMDWIAKYLRQNVATPCNSERMAKEVRCYAKVLFGWTDKHCEEMVPVLTNFYPEKFKVCKGIDAAAKVINIGCFGAIRPLKNQLIQAMAALRLANHLNKKLHFHINFNRVEMGGNPVLTNLIGMFANLEPQGHKLVQHEWRDHKGFKELCRTMDMGMQVSFTETFNIVGADLISEGVPTVGHDIPWMAAEYDAHNDCSEKIYKKLLSSYSHAHKNVYDNQRSLRKYCDRTESNWLAYFKHTLKCHYL